MNNIIYGIDITPLLKARVIFERFRKNLNTEQEKAGAVQSFEMVYELSWKTMKRILDKKGVEVRSPRDCVREAASNGLISDSKLWFDFIEKRNLTTHTYEEKVVDDVIGVFESFSASLTELIDNIQNEK